MTKPLPPFKRATPNKSKAEVKKTPNKKTLRKTADWQEELEAKVLEVIADQHGKANWNDLRKLACKDQRILGLALKSLMDAGRITGPTKEYPGWESTARYRLAVVKVKAQKAA
jgi:hypothetical protein